MLSQGHCEACKRGTPTATDTEVASFATAIPDWAIEIRDDIKQIERVYRFTNFVHALAFTQTIGELSEEQGHHPLLLTEWGSVTVTWWSHKIKGLHRNDFIMAARADALYDKAEGKKDSRPDIC